VGDISPRKNARRLIESFNHWWNRGSPRACYRLLITGTSLDRGFLENGAAVPARLSLFR